MGGKFEEKGREGKGREVKYATISFLSQVLFSLILTIILF
jgi:hypothetical protein